MRSHITKKNKKVPCLLFFVSENHDSFACICAYIWNNFFSDFATIMGRSAIGKQLEKERKNRQRSRKKGKYSMFQLYFSKMLPQTL